MCVTDMQIDSSFFPLLISPSVDNTAIIKIFSPLLESAVATLTKDRFFQSQCIALTLKFLPCTKQSDLMGAVSSYPR